MHPTLDPANIKILQLLQQDARQELSVMSRSVHKSTSSISERIRKLQDEGYIKRYVAILDREKIGLPFLAVAQVTLTVHTSAALLYFECQVNQMPEIQLCLHLSGACNFILHIAVADPHEYQDFLMNRLCNMQNVDKVQSFIVLKECKANAPYLL